MEKKRTRSRAKMHIGMIGGTLCNSKSLIASIDTADCVKCNRRFDDVMNFLADEAANGNVKARELMDKHGWKVTRGK